MSLDPRVDDLLRSARSISANAKTVAWLKQHADVVTEHWNGSAVLGLPLRQSEIVADDVVVFEGDGFLVLWNVATGRVTSIDTRLRPKPVPFNAELWRRYLPLFVKPLVVRNVV